MKCLVTGVSGFVGGHVLRHLADLGHEVRGFHREGADLRAVADVDFEPVTGDLADLSAVRKATAGCDRVFHVGAAYALWMKDYKPMYAANVDGTRNVLTAARDAGCSRIVYTSTVGCVGVPDRSRHPIIPSDESHIMTESQALNPYKHSKWLAEQIALRMANEGVPVVIVNPSAPIGPGDIKPTPTGQVIVDFLKRKLPAYLDTGLNWVDVRDVAAGHVLAADKGKIGERYILGHAEGNWTMKQFLEELADITGLKAPKAQVPYAVAWTAAWVSERISAMTGKPPTAPIGGVKMARNLMWFDPSKAVNELGMPQTSVRTAISDAVDYFKSEHSIT